MEQMPVQERKADPVSTNGEIPPSSEVASTAPSPARLRFRILGGILRGMMLVLLLGGVLVLFLVLALGVQLPGMAAQEEKTVSKSAPLTVKLASHYEITDQVCGALRKEKVPEGILLKLKKLEGKKPVAKSRDFIEKLKDVLSEKELKAYQSQILACAIKDEHTLEVPEDVRKTLGILQGKKVKVVAVDRPREGRPWELPGSIALDPTKVNRIRLRFAPAEVVSIGGPENPPDSISGAESREWRSNDSVKKGEVLATFYSVDVGNKKNDLYDALLQLELDQEILERARKLTGYVPEVLMLTYRRNVQSDRNAVVRAVNTLRGWGISEQDIAAVYDDAKKTIAAFKRDGHKLEKEEDLQKATKGQLDRWARVTLKAPEDCVIVERNVAKNELVVDNSVAVFQIANVDKLQVQVNLPEDQLSQLLKLRERLKDVPWKIRTLNPEDGGLLGTISDISYLIDTNEHKAVVKGYIKNPGKRLRGGQFVTATIDVPPPEDVVEVPVDAVVDDGRQCVVFVETDAAKHRYTMRRVEVTHRYEKVLLVRSKPFTREEELTPDEQEDGLLPRRPLKPGERVLAAGVLELKKELEDRESNN